ncbi:MAG: ParB/RepB/Spo0J family partition protein [Leptospiraceae bacterium]|nr:ParB/RepB/Spo0J family partition protein [Leptospiraceae bacterium]
MAKSNVLGRGLGNLIPGGTKKSANEAPVASEHAGNSNLKDIKISDISLNPNQPRKTFRPETISELAETIKLHGLIQPIVVKKINRGYQLIAGERRLRACREAGFVKIPAIIKDYSEKESIEVALLENIQREDLNPIEEGLAYHTIGEKLGLKTSEIAARVGKNRSTVANLIRLLQLPENVKELVAQKKLSEGQARPLLSIGDKRKLAETAEKIIELNMTVREVEDYVAKVIGDAKPGKNSSKTSKVDPSILALESKLRNKLSAKVGIQHNESSGKGKIVLSYGNLDEMERILEKMGIR